MLAQLLVVGLFLQASTVPQASTPSGEEVKATIARATEADTDPNALLKVKRIYVDTFGDDLISRELQSMIVSSLVATKRFRVTENRERADAVLKGVALEKSSQELHAYGEGTSVGGASGGAHADSVSASGGFVARHMGTSDSSANTETINDARIAIRLVNADGDVIWTSTQESKGAKYKGSSADVADRCVKQLLHDVEKLESTNSPTAGTTTAQSDPKKK